MCNERHDEFEEVSDREIKEPEIATKASV
jgi:hypothetical protein